MSYLSKSKCTSVSSVATEYSPGLTRAPLPVEPRWLPAPPGRFAAVFMPLSPAPDDRPGVPEPVGAGADELLIVAGVLAQPTIRSATITARAASPRRMLSCLSSSIAGRRRDGLAPWRRRKPRSTSSIASGSARDLKPRTRARRLPLVVAADAGRRYFLS